MSQLEKVPEELLIYILLYACEHPADLINVSHISKYFSHVIDSPVIWNVIALTRSSKSDFTKPSKLPNSLGPSILLFKYFDRHSPIYFKQTKHKQIDKIQHTDLSLHRIDFVDDIVFHNKDQYIETRKYLHEKHAKMLDKKKRRSMLNILGQKLGYCFPILTFAIMQWFLIALFLALMQMNLYFGLPEWVLPLEDISTAVTFTFLPLQSFLVILLISLAFFTLQSRYVKVTQQYNLWMLISWAVLFGLHHYLKLFKRHLVYYFTNSDLYDSIAWVFLLIPFLGANIMAFVLLLIDETKQHRIRWKPLRFNFPNFQESVPLLLNLCSIPFFILFVGYLSGFSLIPKWSILVPLFALEMVMATVAYQNMNRYYSTGRSNDVGILLFCVILSSVWLQMRIFYGNFESLTYMPTAFVMEALLLKMIAD